MEQKSKFDKVMGAWDILVIAFGAMIGWGWVINSGDWITTAGFMGSIIAMLIGGVMVFFVGLTYAELTSAMPQCGGEHVFSYRAMGPTGSFVCTWMIILGYVATSAFEATALPTVITYLFPKFNQVYLYSIAGKDIYLTTILLGVGVAVLITFINIIGAKTAAILQTVLTAIIAIAGILLVVGSAINGDGANITGQMWESGTGTTLGSVFKVACMTPFLFIGFDVIPQAAEEINVPYKKIGKIMLLSIFLAVAWYLLIIFAVCYIMPQSAIAQEMSSQNGLVSAKAIEIAFRSPLMGKVLIIGGLCGIITSWNSFLMGGSRALYSMGESLMIPKMFGKLGKHKTPEAAIILCGIACVAAPFFGRGVLVWLVDAASFGCVIAYMFVSISFCILRKKKPEMARPYKVKAGRFVGVMAVLMAGFMTLLYIVPASFSAALVWQEWIVVGIWLALGAFFYFYSKKKYGAEFGRDIFIVEDGGKAEEQEEAVLPNAKYPDRHFVITVGCEYGSGGPQIAKMIADRLGIEYYNRDLVDKVVAQIGVDKGLVEEADTKIGVRYAFDTSYGVRYANLSNRVIDAQFQAINDFANRSSCVIVGRSSDYILRNRDDVLNVFIYAPQEDEIAAVMKEKGIKNMRKAKEEWESVDKAQHARHEYITGKKRGDRHTRDMLINSSILGWDETADMIIDMIDRKFEQDDAKQLKKEA
ncbi:MULTISPECIES: amino acid permease [Clostridia]|jgi:amino acid transporter/cytidylate kinase|uniref:amino acid permease n=1 Tax=Clostridia TaxID=186801 RepID=UPI001651CB0E|nr:amino acid permease [Eubacterium sp. AF22-9]